MGVLSTSSAARDNCIELYVKCARACEECTTACLQEQDLQARVKCLQLLNDCAQICRACAESCNNMAS